MATALFEIATGIAFLAVLYVGLLARPAIKGVAGRLQAFGILLIAAGAFCVYEGLDTRDGNFLSAGAVVLALAALLVAVGLGMRARTEQV
ncbi:MAG TPA: hypothetical protein VHA70_03455 [Bauldia sp.]|nr:hypothetical protein [Bauldia sp.]